MSAGVGTLMLAGAGCVLALTETRVDPADGGGFVDRTRAVVLAERGCRSVDVLLPPGAELVRADALMKPGDGGRRRLGPERWQALPRDAHGWARVRLHVPELLQGDRVKLDVTRLLSGDRLEWTPGEDGARFAELELPRKHPWSVEASGVEPERHGWWTSEPEPGAAVRIWSSDAARADDSTWLVTSQDEPGRSGPTTTPAEAVTMVSRYELLPDRPDLIGDPPSAFLSTLQAATLLAITADLPLAAVTDPRRPARPIGALPYTTPDGGVAPRVWAHPEARWDARWTLRLPDGPEVPVGPPAGSGPRLDAPVQIDRRIGITLPDGADPGVALVPGGGSTITYEDRVRLERRGPGARLVQAPPGFRLTDASLDGDGALQLAVTGDQVLLLSPSGDATARLTWQAPDAPTCGRLRDRSVAVDAVDAAGADVRTDETGWWLHAWGERPLATDRERVIGGLTARFNRRSLPEPGLPMRLRGRLRGWELAAELVDTLRDRAVIADLPGADPLWPRRLYRARRSGVVTPVEAALIVRLYGLQAKLEADWVLVRSAEADPAPELCAATYDAMLVRLRFEDEERWLDPACAACAPFEIRPELLGRPALGRGVQITPPPVPGRLSVTVDGPTVLWEAEGAAALELRRWLRDRPVEGRAAALAEHMAGPDATLMSVEGAKGRGVPVRAVARAARLDALPDPARALLPTVGSRVSWPGPRQLTLGPGPTREIRLDPGSWTTERERQARSTLGLQDLTER